MTAVNAVVQAKRGYLYADTAFCDLDTGNVIGFCTKIWAGSCFPWAVGVTASGAPTDYAHAIQPIADVKNVMALKAALPGAVKEFTRRSLERGTKKPFLRLTVVAWDARLQKPRIFMISTLEGDLLGRVKPGEVYEASHFFSGVDDISHIWKGKSPSLAQHFDVDADGIAAMEAIRGRPYEPIVGGEVRSWVGGEIEQAVISRKGVELYSLHKWDDEIGKPIAPV